MPPHSCWRRPLWRLLGSRPFTEKSKSGRLLIKVLRHLSGGTSATNSLNQPSRWQTRFFPNTRLEWYRVACLPVCSVDRYDWLIFLFDKDHHQTQLYELYNGIKEKKDRILQLQCWHIFIVGNVVHVSAYRSIIGHPVFCNNIERKIMYIPTTLILVQVIPLC